MAKMRAISFCLRLGGTFGWSEGVSGTAPLNTVEPWKAVAWAGFAGPEENWGLELVGTYVAAKTEAKINKPFVGFAPGSALKFGLPATKAFISAR